MDELQGSAFGVWAALQFILMFQRKTSIEELS
jgi:hypothetical protein